MPKARTGPMSDVERMDYRRAVAALRDITPYAGPIGVACHLCRGAEAHNCIRCRRIKEAQSCVHDLEKVLGA